MQTVCSIRKLSILCFVLCLFLAGNPGDTTAQQVLGLYFSYDYFPYSKLADPEALTEDLEIRTASWNAGLSFPLAFDDGRIMIFNQINYRRVDFEYKNLPGGSEIEQAQSIEYTFFLVDSLSQNWKFVAVATPGLASDFNAKVSSDDFTITGVLGVIRRFRPNLEIGFGVSYMRDFGDPIPLPFIYFDWNNGGRLRANGILPQNMDVFYDYNSKLSMGISLKILGNRYHGDPGKFGVDNPQMVYSEGTISPVARINVSDWIHLNIEGGFAFYRNFEFMDGDDTVQSLDMEKAGYLRASIELGI